MGWRQDSWGVVSCRGVGVGGCRAAASASMGKEDSCRLRTLMAPYVLFVNNKDSAQDTKRWQWPRVLSCFVPKGVTLPGVTEVEG